MSGHSGKRCAVTGRQDVMDPLSPFLLVAVGWDRELRGICGQYPFLHSPTEALCFRRSLFQAVLGASQRVVVWTRCIPESEPRARCWRNPSQPSQQQTRNQNVLNP